MKLRGSIVAGKFSIYCLPSRVREGKAEVEGASGGYMRSSKASTSLPAQYRLASYLSLVFKLLNSWRG